MDNFENFNLSVIQEDLKTFGWTSKIEKDRDEEEFVFSGFMTNTGFSVSMALKIVDGILLVRTHKMLINVPSSHDITFMKYNAECFLCNFARIKNTLVQVTLSVVLIFLVFFTLEKPFLLI